MKISQEEALMCVGGGITASLLNAAVSLIKQIYTMGQNLGSAISRAINGKNCG